MRAYTRLVDWAVRHRFITVAVGLVLFGLSIWQRATSAVGLSARRRYLALAACHRAAARLAALRHRSSHRRHRQRACASGRRSSSVFVDGGRIPRRRDRGPQGGADDQLRAEIETVALAAASSSRRSAATSQTYRISATGSSTRTASATSPSSSPARTMPRSRTWRPSSPRRCADFPMVTNVSSGATLEPPGAANLPAPGSGRAPGRIDREPVGNHPRRDHRRRRPGARKVRCRRSDHSDPRAARGKGARRPAGSRTNPRPVAARRRRAARRPCRHQLRRRPGQHHRATTVSGRPASRRIWSAVPRSAMRRKPIKACR